MGLKGISARRARGGATEVRFDFGRGDIVAYKFRRGDTEATFKRALEDDAKSKTGTTRRDLSAKMPEFFTHINRDGSVAIATGDEPDVWPEDMS